ncbi:MAG: tetratricopeptide repeat protein [Chloroflexi bacterium]|nr:tetratricopeptide repeat protein [Chloroflexota bacterium]
MADSISALIAQSQDLSRAGQVGSAFRLAQQALTLAQNGKDAAILARAMTNLAHVHFRLGHYEQSQSLASAALPHATDDTRARVDALLLLGLNAAETDDPDAAEAYYHQAIDLSRQEGYDEALIRGLHNLVAGVYIPRGQFSLALALDEDAYRLAQERQMPERAWNALAAMGWVYYTQGQWQEARRMAALLEPLAPAGSLARGFHDCLLADLAQEEGENEEALRLYAAARAVADVVGDPGLNVLVRLGLSRWHRRREQAAAAWDWADTAFALAQRVGSVPLQGMALIARARAAWAQGERREAEEDLRQAITLMEPLEFAYELARAWLLLAALLQEEGEEQAARAWGKATEYISQGHYYFLLERERALAFPLLTHFQTDSTTGLRTLSRSLLQHLAQVPPPPLRIFLLGRFEVHQGSRRIADSAWSKRRAGSLFCMLLLSPQQTLTQEQVISHFWPEKDILSAQSLLHQTTSALRRALEPDLPRKFPSRYLLVEEGIIRLILPPGTWIDTQAFTKLLAQGAYEEALSLYKGELLPAHRYADWAIWERERLQQHFLQALLAAAEAALAEGRAQRALELTRQVLAHEPWQEQAVRIGMDASILLRDRTTALRLYQTLAQRLQSELGIEPGSAGKRVTGLISTGMQGKKVGRKQRVSRLSVRCANMG